MFESGTGKLNILRTVFNERDIQNLTLTRGFNSERYVSAFDRRKNGRQRGSQRLGQSSDARQGWIAFAAFYVTHVSAMEIRSLGQLLLRHSEAGPPSLYFGAEQSFYIQFHFARDIDLVVNTNSTDYELQYPDRIREMPSFKPASALTRWEKTCDALACQALTVVPLCPHWARVFHPWTRYRGAVITPLS